LGAPLTVRNAGICGGAQEAGIREPIGAAPGPVNIGHFGPGVLRAAAALCERDARLT